MTNEEAAHIVDVAFDIPQAVRRAGEDRTYHEDEVRKAKAMAIKALERRHAKDIHINEGRRECPRCGDRIRITGPGGVPNDYCGNCGQKLSWKNDMQRMPWE